MSESQNSSLAGKSSAKKLGRGLSALLGSPVQIRIPAVQPGFQGASASPDDDATPRSMQEQIPTAQGSEGPQVDAAPEGVAAQYGSESRSAPLVAPDRQDGRTPRGIVEIHVEHIKPNQRQPRTDFNEDSIRGLASSIRQAGLMQPIVVRPTKTGYELIAGERRWRAAKLLGLSLIPAIVRDLDDQASAEFALIENVQREDLNPMDRAIALRRLATDFGLTHQVIADRVGLDRASVTNLLRLSDLDTASAQLIRSGALSQGHGKALLALPDLSVRRSMAERAIKQDWSVRELERRIQHVQHPDGTTVAGAVPSRTDKSPRSANAADLERKLAEHLGTRVAIQLGRKKGSGRLVLDFYSLDQFDGLMQRLGFDPSRM
jgi:ParB family chromosome partitioning protein